MSRHFGHLARASSTNEERWELEFTFPPAFRTLGETRQEAARRERDSRTPSPPA
jgi:hypothetical protein